MVNTAFHLSYLDRTLQRNVVFEDKSNIFPFFKKFRKNFANNEDKLRRDYFEPECELEWNGWD